MAIFITIFMTNKITYKEISKSSQQKILFSNYAGGSKLCESFQIVIFVSQTQNMAVSDVFLNKKTVNQNFRPLGSFCKGCLSDKEAQKGPEAQK